MNTSLVSTLSGVTHAIMLAFADVHYPESRMREAMQARNLQFRAPGWMPVSEAMEIMAEACPSYNEFAPELLALLPADAQVSIAREYSVAIYVKGNPFAISAEDAYAYGKNAEANPQLKADEISYDAEKDETRLWFD